MKHRLPGILHGQISTSVAALLACSLAGAAFAAQSAASPASSPSATAPVLLSPTLGRPVFAEPGATVEILVQIPDATGTVAIRLISNSLPQIQYLLAPPADAATAVTAGTPLLVQVPADVPERTYDVEITSGAARLLGRHCVAIKRLGTQIRIVHLSNMNIGDLAAPDFDERLIDEVNVVAPDLIVASGDFVDRTAAGAEAIWERLPEFFSRFDAPAFIACGDHDDPQEYALHVAPNPIGTVEVGFLRGFAIYDRPTRPISDDSGQQQWLEHGLAAAGDQRLKFIVTHDDRPNLLLNWQKRGVLADMISGARLGLWLAGGHRDWDGVEYADIIHEAAPLLYVRTHQSSSSTLDGAGGVSHFRVLDITDERVAAPGWNLSETGAPSSLAVGRLSCLTSGRNDGTEGSVAVNVVNNHPFRIDHLQARVLLAGGPEARPWCLGAELISAQFIGDKWECRVGFNLPDKGAAQALVGTGATPILPTWKVRFELPAVLRLAQQKSPEGLSYAAAGNVNALIYLTNTGAAAADVTPLLRLDGDTLSYKVVEETGPPAAAYALHIPPQGSVTLQPDLSALRAAAGRRELQVYMKGLPAWTPACQPLTIVISP
jgi:hypothetical protein